MSFFDFAKSVGGGSLIGGALGAVGSLINGSRSSDNVKSQMQMQREFAQNGVRWKVADAKAAGIHPLAALGAQTVSYSPVAVGDDGLGSALQTMGQGISRAVEAKQLQEEREAAQARQEMADVFNMARSQKELEHMDLQNEFLRTQIAGARNAVTQTALPPPMPKVNQPTPDSSGLFLDKPIVRDGWVIDEKGRKVGILPGEDVASRVEDKLIVEWVPFMGSAVRSFRGKFLGQKVNGHWWHGDDKGFLPYPPKKEKGFFGHARDAIRFYSDYSN